MKFQAKILIPILALVLIFPATAAIYSLRPLEKKNTPQNFSVTPYVDPLPIPRHIVVPTGVSDITIRLNQFESQLHSNFPKAATMWGYEGSSPGPVIDVEQNQKVRVHWKNELPTTHVFPPVPGAMNMGVTPGSKIVFDGPTTAIQETNTFFRMIFDASSANLPDVRNITHLHGAFVSEMNPLDRHYNNDGWPDAWNVPGEEQIAEYPNQQSARTLFYHDHAFAQTGRNVAAGLVGTYIIHDDYERLLNLPSGKYEIPLLFQAAQFEGDGVRTYTDQVDKEFFGNGVLVNGKLMPYLEVEPRKYRFRMVNAGNARELGLSLIDQSSVNTPGPVFYQIASDAGFLEKTVVLNDKTSEKPLQLFIDPAERADVIIDFSPYAGRNFILLNSNSITDHDGEMPLYQIMLFKVGTKVSAPDTSSLPMQMKKIEKLKVEDAVAKRQIVLSQTDKPDGSSLFQIDHRAWVYPKEDAKAQEYWDYEISHKTKANSIEVWDLINTSILMHPFHVHQVQFQLLERRPFNVDKYNETGVIEFTGDAIAPDANEAGWKDVIRANQRQVTRIIMRFGPETGYYVYHCHILEHEDMDMMVPFQVLPGAPKIKQR